MYRKTFIVAAFLGLVGCATTQNSTGWNDDTVSQLSEGMAKAEVVEIFGNPTKKVTHSGNKDVWIYRRPADGTEASATFIAITTFGARAGENAITVDALSIMFENDRVLKFKYEENADNNMVEAGGY